MRPSRPPGIRSGWSIGVYAPRSLPDACPRLRPVRVAMGLWRDVRATYHEDFQGFPLTTFAVTALPLTPERVLEAVRRKRAEQT